MATHATLDREAVLAAREKLQPARGSGWLGGFNNMFHKELGETFLRRRWLWQTLIWLVLIPGLLAFILFVVPIIEENSGQPSSTPTDPAGIALLGLATFFGMLVQIGTIGMIVISQDEIIQEKQSGTAAWILSKPASRYSFVLAKVLANAIGALAFILVIPAVVAYFEIYLASGETVPVLPYLLAAGVAYLGLIFYLTLVIMLGVFFDNRVPVLGITFGVYIGGLLLVSFVPEIAYILPVSLQEITLAIAQGNSLPAVYVIELIAMVVLSIVFLLVALFQFHREEF